MTKASSIAMYIVYYKDNRQSILLTGINILGVVYICSEPASFCDECNDKSDEFNILQINDNVCTYVRRSQCM